MACTKTILGSKAQVPFRIHETGIKSFDIEYVLSRENTSLFPLGDMMFIARGTETSATF
jgi:hypothetical protein